MTMLRMLLLAGWLALLATACDLSQSQRTPARFSPTLTATPTVFPSIERSDTPAGAPFTVPTPLVVAPASQTPFECGNTLRTRLILGERGRVLDDDPRAINVRAGPGTSFRILGRIEVNELFYVLDGPACADSYTWYQVSYGNLQGWIAEGDATSYYVEPFMPG